MRPAVFFSLILLIASCNSTTGVKPIASPDPDIQCPAGRVNWSLRVSDQRAQRRESDQVVALVRDSLSKSLPGCRWSGGADAGTISIEIHRFGARLDEAMWDAAADWTVSVRDASGRTLTEFDSSSELTRPNYRNVNNERAILQEALDEAMQRTLKGLRALSPQG
ncbi:MAG TPA: hypothetical protein VK780_08430 [Thermoanaerobaculia bacterium]|jgi:hypothetical protein|nr:hypothetical protein [Thermoanaerobaculia bacterium]